MKRRAEFSTKDSFTAARLYPGNAYFFLAVAGVGGVWKLGYAILDTILKGVGGKFLDNFLYLFCQYY